MYHDVSGLSLHTLALPRQFIELSPVDFHRGIHGRNLLLGAHKLRQHRFQLLPGYINRLLLQYLAGDILSIGHRAQEQLCHVFLFVILAQLHRPGTAAQKYRQNPRGHGIQCAGMPDASLPINAPELCHHIVGRPPLGLIH